MGTGKVRELSKPKYESASRTIIIIASNKSEIALLFDAVMYHR